MSALMFQRLAHSFIKNGYYPTDSKTLVSILNAIEADEQPGKINIIDPCAGEGVALAECQQHLNSERVRSYAVEFNEERANHAKTLVDYCIHGDLQDCLLGQRQFSLLFLNPPYGDMVADKAKLSNKTGRQRLEKLFYAKCSSLLQFGGLMVLILPHYTLDKELSNWIARHHTDVKAYLAADKTYKQVVIFGVRNRVSDMKNSHVIAQKLQKIGQGQLPEVIPTQWNMKTYQIPSYKQSNDVKFVYTRLDQSQLVDEFANNPGIWKQFDMLFGQQVQTQRRPLCQMTDWHLALALAAGQVSGVVTDKNQRKFVIKGDTYKDRTSKTSVNEGNDGSIKETRTVTDCFIPAIRALDVTPGSPTIGEAFTIK